MFVMNATADYLSRERQSAEELLKNNSTWSFVSVNMKVRQGKSGVLN